MKETFTILNWNKSVKILKIIHSKQTLRQQFYFDVYEIQSKEKELRKQTNFSFDKKFEFVEIKKRYNGHLTPRYNYEHERKKKKLKLGKSSNDDDSWIQKVCRRTKIKYPKKIDLRFNLKSFIKKRIR
jgi:hypothetical protein